MNRQLCILRHFVALALLVAQGHLFAQSLPNAVPMPTPEIQYLDRNGKPLAGSKLCTYAAGTNTPLATYTSSAAGTPNTNPVVLDVNGRASVWVGPQSYKFVLRTGGDSTCTTGTVVWTQDNVQDTTLYFVNYVKTAGTATLITYTNPLTNAVQRTVASRLSDFTTVKDYGAACDGASDDTTKIQAAINATAAAGIEINLPGGTCLFSALTLPTNAHIVGQGAANSALKALASSGVNNTPLLKNADQSSGNSGITLEGFTLDGNVAHQGSTNVYGVALVKASSISIYSMQFVNISAAPVFGINWTNVTVRDSSFSDYGSTSTTFPNSGAIQMDYGSATAPSSGIIIDGNHIDGSGGAVGGIKINGTSANPVSSVVVNHNYIVTGDNSDTLGVEVFSSGTGASNGYDGIAISGNVIRGVSSTSQASHCTWGISVAGYGGSNISITGNSIKWTGCYSIELAASQNASISGNSIQDSACICVLAAAPGIASGSVHLKNISVTGNSVINPRAFNESTNQLAGINVYGESGHSAGAVSIVGNSVVISSDATTAHGVWLQCNSSTGSFSNFSITSNTITGPGPSSTSKGLILEVDGPCPISGAVVSGNSFSSLLQAISGDDITSSIVYGNSFSSVGSRYGAGLSATTPYMELVPNATPFLLTNAFSWNPYTPTFSVAGGGGGTISVVDTDAAYFQVGATVFIRVYAIMTIATTPSDRIFFTVPVIPGGAAFTNQMIPCILINGGLGTSRPSVTRFANDTQARIWPSQADVTFPIATPLSLSCDGSYQAAALVAP